MSQNNINNVRNWQETELKFESFIAKDSSVSSTMCLRFRNFVDCRTIK